MRHPVDGGAKSDGEGKANVYSLCVGSSRFTCSNSHVTPMTLPFGEQQDEGIAKRYLGRFYKEKIIVWKLQ